MVLSRLRPVFQHYTRRGLHLQSVKMATHSNSGGVLPEPQKTSFGIFRVIMTVTVGLLIGAAISKNIANFLEENDLFVPSDDDDDDD